MRQQTGDEGIQYYEATETGRKACSRDRDKDQDASLVAISIVILIVMPISYVLAGNVSIRPWKYMR